MHLPVLEWPCLMPIVGDTMAMAMDVAMEDTMVIILVRDLLMPRLPLRLMLLLTMDTMAMVMDMVIGPMDIILVRDLLMPRLPLRLMLLPLLTIDTMAMVMDMVMDTMDITLARGLLMLPLPTMVTMAMDLVVDMDMVVDTDTGAKLPNNLIKSSLFTALSTVKFICDFSLKWSIKALATPYNQNLKKCQLCLTECVSIAHASRSTTTSLNMRNEIFNHCIHRKKYLLDPT